MNTQKPKSALHESLDRLETCLETPVVPGELPGWCDDAEHACMEVKSHLSREVAEIHPPLFEQIQAEDPALAPRVEEMCEIDKQLLTEVEQVAAYLDRLTEIAGEIEPDEAKVDEHVQRAVDRGLQLVLSVRKQDTALTTWYMEALDRDRGTVD
jgi:hypothetical protein